MSTKKIVASEVHLETSRLRMFGSQLSCKIRSALALTVCGCLFLPLTGCGGNSLLDPGKTATASDLLYSSKGIDLELLSNGDPVSAILDIASENGTTTVLLQCQSQEESSPTENEETVSEYSYSIIHINSNGEILDNIPLDTIIDTATDVPVAISKSNDGNWYLLYTHTDPKIRKVAYQITEIDNSGNLIKSAVTLMTADGAALKKFAVGENDSLIFAETVGSTGSIGSSGSLGSSGRISGFGQDGQLIYQIVDQTLTGEVYRVGDKIYVGKYSQDVSQTTIFELDEEAAVAGDTVDLPEEADEVLSAVMMSDGQNLYSCAADGLYQIDLANRQVSNILFWKNCDIPFSANGILYACRLSDTSCLVEYIGNDGNPKMSILSQRGSAQVTNKKIVTLGGLYVSRNPILVKAVYDFNAANSEYQIQIKDYSGDEAEDYSGDDTDAVNAMNTGILTGDGPDIICGKESFQVYEDSGVLLDFNTLIAADDTFHKDEYYLNMFSLCENEGKLFKIFPCYSVQGLTGAKSVIGDRTGWTIDEFKAWAAGVPGGITMSDAILQSALVAYTVSCDLDSFVNWDTKEVDFENQAFYQLLEYAKEYGLTQDEYEQSSQSNYLIDDKADINRAYIESADSYNIFVQIYGGEIAVTGYPSYNKSGPVCVPGYFLGISASSKNKDAAWEFVKYLLSENCQKAMRENYSIPVLTRLLDEQIDLTVHPEKADAASGVVYEGMYEMSEKSAQDFRGLINGLTSIPNYSTAINSIIQEEIPAYFNGDKTVEEVAGTIQNRAQIVVNETF